jgi:DNA-binding transcriptional LysR family regulator
MELHHLRCFVAVAAERHFGRAAQRLHLTPAPVSRAIRSLEDELGVVLFTRAHHEVRLTAAGQTLYAHAAEVLRCADDLRDHARSLHEPNTIVVGATHISPPAVLDRIVEMLRDTSRVVVRAELVDPANLARMLRDGTLDFALLNATSDCADLVSRPVAVLDYVLVLCRDDPLAERDSIDWVELRERDITLPDNTPFPSVLNELHDYFLRHGVTRFDRINTFDIAAMASRVRLRRTVIPSLDLAAGGPWRVFDDPAFVIRPFRAPPPPYVLSLAWNPMRSDLLGVCASTFSESGGVESIERVGVYGVGDCLALSGT